MKFSLTVETLPDGRKWHRYFVDGVEVTRKGYSDALRPPSEAALEHFRSLEPPWDLDEPDIRNPTEENP